MVTKQNFEAFMQRLHTYREKCAKVDDAIAELSGDSTPVTNIGGVGEDLIVDILEAALGDSKTHFLSTLLYGCDGDLSEIPGYEAGSDWGAVYDLMTQRR